MLTRRQAMILTGAGIPALVRMNAAAGPEFWEKKPPSEWNSDEIDRLITKSPWAKEATASYSPESSGGALGSARQRVGIGGIPGLGGRGGRGNRGGDSQGATSSYKGTVRWESARPILEAMKTPLPEQFAKHYVISVNGVPLLGERARDDSEATPRTQDDPYDNLKQFTTLQPRGKELIQAGVVHRQVSSGSSFLFGFSSELLPLSTGDNEAVFATRLGQLTVKTRFVFKEMLYHGELAL